MEEEGEAEGEERGDNSRNEEILLGLERDLVGELGVDSFFDHVFELLNQTKPKAKGSRVSSDSRRLDLVSSHQLSLPPSGYF